MERNPEKSKQFTDKLRNKIWGTEDAPGREDPYSRDSPMRVPRQVTAEDEGKARKAGVEEASEEDRAEWEREMEEEQAFKPAQTWDGLERVGSKQWAEEFQEWRRGRPHFEKTFMSATKLTHRKQIELALHRALVEAFTLRESGLDLAMASVSVQTQSKPDWIDKVKVGPSSDKTSVVLEFPDAVAKAQLLESIKKLTNQAQNVSNERTTTGEALTEGQTHTKALEELVNESEETIAEMKGTVSLLRGWAAPTDAFHAAEQLNVKATKSKSLLKESRVEPTLWGSGWRSISLGDLEIKFAVVKRLMQLTGNRIPDPVIQDSKTVSELLERLSAPPKPKKLGEAIQRDRKFEKISNVKVYNRRVTPVDKQKEVGRWKVIEYALHERGLPIVGHE